MSEQLSPKFAPGDLLVSEKHPTYYLFVNEMTNDKYHVSHTYVYENELSISYTKNAGHESWLNFKWAEDGVNCNLTRSDYGKFQKVGHIPLLIYHKMVKINK